MALFGEKYGANVRMVTVEGSKSAHIEPSRELCGGTHVRRTGDIGAFVVVSDSAIASGTRRIEALCGHQALQMLKGEASLLARTAELLQASPAALPEQVQKLRAENERLKKTLAEQEKGGLEAEMAKLAASATASPGGRWVVAEIGSGADANAVREAADQLRGKLGTGAAVLALKSADKLTFLAAVTDDLVKAKTLRADDLVRAVARVAGGSGGGKPHLALAGAKDPARLEDALAEARRLLEEAFAG
jgi:alanyl-tRNA synthetase